MAGFAALAHLAGTIACAVGAARIGAWRHHYGKAGGALVATMSLWAVRELAILLAGQASPVSAIAAALANVSWLAVLYYFFASDGRVRSVAPVRPVLVTLFLVQMLTPALALLPANTPGALWAGQVAVLFRLLVTIGGLVLVHNLYVGASDATQRVLRWPAGALTLTWGFDLNYHTITYLSGEAPAALTALRGMIPVAVVAMLALGTHQTSADVRFSPSRAVRFRTASLLLIGIYLLAMVGIARWISFAGGDFARTTQLGFVILASGAALVLLPSRQLRGWLRVTLVKHLFQHRYDYRAEWLRFTHTIGRGDDQAATFEERIVKSVADMTDSPAGLLLLPADAGGLQLAARWQWPTAEVPGEAMSAMAVRFFESRGYIAELDAVRAGSSRNGEDQVLPEWLVGDERAWAVIPLLHFERLVGVVVLARPHYDRRLDWEDLDLLRVAGRQLASYLAEYAGQAVLAEAARFDEFNRRIAFVMHDIKNLASQLGLLARNAELHADNPEFRADMLVTLRNSADKLNAMIARLSRYNPSKGETLAEMDAAALLERVAQAAGQSHQVTVTLAEPCKIAAHPDALEQALLHLVQNAVEASDSGSPVFLSLSVKDLVARIEVLDAGKGMSPEFVRTRLFKPFVSSKDGGFGIGAYEARELIAAMGGRLDVESREGVGSRFIITLPLAAAASALKSFAERDRSAA